MDVCGLRKGVGEVRPEVDILAQIITWANAWDNVRAVVLTSSRSDPRHRQDDLSDYDIEVFVRDVAPLLADDSWLAPFGEILVRWPRRPGPTGADGWITQLAQFTDGLRIDFQFTAGSEPDRIELDHGYRVLVDKDGLTADWPLPTFTSYTVQPPSEDEFADTVNAFWWDMLYVAKALRRGELPFARYMLDAAIRYESLERLLGWHVGATVGWGTAVGLHGKWLEQHLSRELWAKYLETCRGGDAVEVERAMWAMVELAGEVGRGLGFTYPEELEARVTRLMRAKLAQLRGQYTHYRPGRSRPGL